MHVSLMKITVLISTLLDAVCGGVLHYGRPAVKKAVDESWTDPSIPASQSNKDQKGKPEDVIARHGSEGVGHEFIEKQQDHNVMLKKCYRDHNPAIVIGDDVSYHERSRVGNTCAHMRASVHNANRFAHAERGRKSARNACTSVRLEGEEITTDRKTGGKSKRSGTHSELRRFTDAFGNVKNLQDLNERGQGAYLQTVNFNTKPYRVQGNLKSSPTKHHPQGVAKHRSPAKKHWCGDVKHQVELQQRHGNHYMKQPGARGNLKLCEPVTCSKRQKRREQLRNNERNHRQANLPRGINEAQNILVNYPTEEMSETMFPLIEEIYKKNAISPVDCAAGIPVKACKKSKGSKKKDRKNKTNMSAACGTPQPAKKSAKGAKRKNDKHSQETIINQCDEAVKACYKQINMAKESNKAARICCKATIKSVANEKNSKSKGKKKCACEKSYPKANNDYAWLYNNSPDKNAKKEQCKPKSLFSCIRKSSKLRGESATPCVGCVDRKACKKSAKKQKNGKKAVKYASDPMGNLFQHGVNVWQNVDDVSVYKPFLPPKCAVDMKAAMRLQPAAYNGVETKKNSKGIKKSSEMSSDERDQMKLSSLITQLLEHVDEKLDNNFPYKGINVNPMTVTQKPNAVQVTPSNAVQETPSNMVQVTPYNIVQVTPSNMVQVTPSNVVQVTPSNAVQVTPSNVVQVTPYNVVQVTPSTVVQEMPSNMVQVPPSNVVQVAPSNVVKVAPSNIVQVTSCNAVPQVTPSTLQLAGSISPLELSNYGPKTLVPAAPRSNPNNVAAVGTAALEVANNAAPVGTRSNSESVKLEERIETKLRCMDLKELINLLRVLQQEIDLKYQNKEESSLIGNGLPEVAVLRAVPRTPETQQLTMGVPNNVAPNPQISSTVTGNANSVGAVGNACIAEVGKPAVKLEPKRRNMNLKELSTLLREIKQEIDVKSGTKQQAPQTRSSSAVISEPLPTAHVRASPYGNPGVPASTRCDHSGACHSQTSPTHPKTLCDLIQARLQHCQTDVSKSRTALAPYVVQVTSMAERAPVASVGASVKSPSVGQTAAWNGKRTDEKPTAVNPVPAESCVSRVEKSRDEPHAGYFKRMSSGRVEDLKMKHQLASSGSRNADVDLLIHLDEVKKGSLEDSITSKSEDNQRRVGDLKKALRLKTCARVLKGNCWKDENHARNK